MNTSNFITEVTQQHAHTPEDCKSCRYLGTYDGNDLYICIPPDYDRRGSADITLIARDGEDGEYTAGASFCRSNPWIAKAFHLAVAEGYMSTSTMHLMLSEIYRSSIPAADVYPNKNAPRQTADSTPDVLFWLKAQCSRHTRDTSGELDVRVCTFVYERIYKSAVNNRYDHMLTGERNKDIAFYKDLAEHHIAGELAAKQRYEAYKSGAQS